MTLDSGNIRFVRILPGYPWRGGIKRQYRVIRNVDFQDFRTLRLRQLRKCSQYYYIVSAPCRLSTDPEIGLHDLEWPFYVQFSIFTITNRVSAIRLHTYRRTIYRIFLYDITSKDVRKRPVKLRSAVYCGSEREFIRTKHAGNQKGLYMVPIIQLIVVNSIQTYKNKNKNKKNVHIDIHSNTVTDATSPTSQEIIIVHAK